MPDFQYRIFVNNENILEKSMDVIDEISIDQEIDMVWEIQLKILYSLDKGTWSRDVGELSSPCTRIRLEMKIDDNPFVPLIDGPVTGFTSHMNTEPGKSTFTVIARDDSVFLNHREEVVNFENNSDSEVALKIYGGFSDIIASTEIENTPASGSSLDPFVVQRGTPMQILKKLAKRHGMHAYVLPGEKPGESIGCFKPFSTQPGELPPLVLLGENRNVNSLDVAFRGCKPAKATASSLRITDKQVISETSLIGRMNLLGDKPVMDESIMGLQILPPEQGESVSLSQAVAALQNISNYSYTVTGTLLENTYTHILVPYLIVSVHAGDTPVSGDYLIKRVNHTITRSSYVQSFTLIRNAVSEDFQPSNAKQGGIF